MYFVISMVSFFSTKITKADQIKENISARIYFGTVLNLTSYGKIE